MTVKYDPEVTDFEALVRLGKARGCADSAWVRDSEQLEIAKRVLGGKASITNDVARTSKESDLLFYLKKSPLRFLPLSPLQRIRVNAELGTRGGDPTHWLSPRQRRLAERLKDEGMRAKLGRLKALPPLEALWNFES